MRRPSYTAKPALYNISARYGFGSGYLQQATEAWQVGHVRSHGRLRFDSPFVRRTFDRSAPRAWKLFYECPRSVDADFAMLIANCRARGSALSGVCLRVASQRPWAKQVLIAYGTMCSETTSRVREAGKRLAPSRSHKSLTEPISFR